MDAVALGIIPQLIRGLCEHFVKDDAQDISAENWKPLESDFPSPFNLPNPSKMSPVDLMDKEFALISVACDYAVHALSSYAHHMQAALRIRRNRRLPAYRLPNEILAIIFGFAVASSSNRLRPLSRKAPLNLSHVSKLWRDVALGTPRLWTNYDPVNARLAQIFIDRSQQAPLSIYMTSYNDRTFEFSDDEDPEERQARFPITREHVTQAHAVQLANFPDFIHPLIPHISRWGELHLEGVKWAQLRRFIRNPAPILSALYLGGTEKHDISAAQGVLFGGSTPLLRDLRLQTNGPPLDSPIYASLTTLMLEHIDYRHGTIQKLLHILSACPALEILCLRMVRLLGPPGQGSSLVTSHIPLSCLRDMDLALDESSLVRAIVSSVIVPPSAQFELTVGLNDRQDLRAIFSPTLDLSGCLPNISSITWAVFRLSALPTMMYLGMFGGVSTNKHCLLNLKIANRKDDVSMLERIIPNVVRDIPSLRSLVSVLFNSIPEAALSAASFSGLLHDLPHIVTLTLSACPWAFVKALIVRPTSHLCPCLQDLRLQDIPIDKGVLLEVAASRTARSLPAGLPETTCLSRLIVSHCEGLDLPTVLALRNLPLHVKLLPPGLRISGPESDWVDG
ncbi:hypothetical protein BOTBODRAFT_174668 [Botryobasidium botryosum FD-172 SS1]|uniref:F-box domain-containing protein n=1 Tax=Botryobasidium botryosum (strain FD-172 SS1) TaxID=930990 RepID=A0A067MSC8_BOTB1|nr:hypothetical protein BOTBODRAFT_174668 [Botryobasidium botryosum FD-172 SS1]